MTANEKARYELMLMIAKLNNAQDMNNGKPLDDYGRAYLDGMISTLETILDQHKKEGN